MASEYSPSTQCRDKFGHATRKAARQHKADILARDPDAVINVYRCPHCGLFHVGNSVKARERDADREHAR